MRITEKGQVTIPIEIRRRLGLRPGDEIEFVVEDNGARLVRAASTPSRGKRITRRLLNSGDVPLSTDEIMALTRGE